MSKGICPGTPMTDYYELARRWASKFEVEAPRIELKPIAKTIVRTRRTPRSIIRETKILVGQYFPKTKTIVLDPKYSSVDVLKHEFAHHLQFELKEYRRIGGIKGRGMKAGLESNVRRMLRWVE